MITVYKFPFDIQDVIKVKMPVGAEILSVSMQVNVPVMWAKVDTFAHQEWRKFRVTGTGHPLVLEKSMQVGRFIGTIFWQTLVFHVFEVQS